MDHADVDDTQKKASVQFTDRGYILAEEAEFMLKDIANGLDALAQLCEDSSNDMPEIQPEN